MEGTRFTSEKHARQKSRFKHLLKPKAGGLAIVFSAMGSQFDSILNVTIAYPDGAPSMWEFLQGRTPEIRIRVESIPSDGENWAVGGTDKEIRRQVTRRLNDLWEEKDASLARLLGSDARPYIPG